MVKKLNVLIFFLFNIAVLAAGGFYGYNDWQNKKIQGSALETDTMKSVIVSDSEMPKIALKDFEPDAAVLGEALIEEGQQIAPEPNGDPNRNLFGDEAEKQSSAGDDGKNNFSFAVIGDSESYSQAGYNEELASVLQSVKARNPDLVFFAGDLISLSAPTIKENEQKLGGLLALIGNYFEKYYIAFGNHDVECGAECVDLWQKLFFKKEPNPDEKPAFYHSFDYQGTHFAILSSSYPLEKKIDDSQMDWLDKDLAATAKINKIVIVHVPPVTFFEKAASGCHDMSCDPAARAKLNQILAKHKVDLVISGHENAFDHKIADGIDYVLAGNTGNKPKYKGVVKGDIFSIISVKDGAISLKALKTSGEIVREINIK